MPLPYIGEIRQVSFSFAPQGWALCNGQLLPINQNQALFSILGATYGGDGRTNFALPDLRGRSPVGLATNLPLGTRVEPAATSATTREVVDTITITRGLQVNRTANLLPDTSGAMEPPIAGINYIIALVGLFPSPN